ncbi:hypothetical protein Tsp_12311, partial [Trichinella spiralis]|uniref:hypothetical protein n=1 Tax=Trichinella spiralis TaxID=6334 RepID=UPI0001EFD81B
MESLFAHASRYLQTPLTGGVSLRISSKICPRSLFSLTPNVIGRYRIFNCSTESLLAHASRYLQTIF